MKNLIAAVALAMAFASVAHSAKDWEWALRPAKAQYVIYGGGLGDTYAPSANDAHVAFYVHGPAAKQMFDAMGPDRKSECGIEKGGRVREREHLACRFRPSDGYQCDFGFDLRSGKSIGGSIC